MSIHVSQLTSHSTFSFTLYLLCCTVRSLCDGEVWTTRKWRARGCITILGQENCPPFLIRFKACQYVSESISLAITSQIDHSNRLTHLSYQLISYLYIFLVLFQMALIPFTMSRYTIASLSNSKLNDYLPLNKSMSIHIYLGYTMVCFSIMATVIVSIFFFFCFFCSEWCT